MSYPSSTSATPRRDAAEALLASLAVRPETVTELIVRLDAEIAAKAVADRAAAEAAARDHRERQQAEIKKQVAKRDRIMTRMVPEMVAIAMGVDVSAPDLATHVHEAREPGRSDPTKMWMIGSLIDWLDANPGRANLAAVKYQTDPRVHLQPLH